MIGDELRRALVAAVEPHVAARLAALDVRYTEEIGASVADAVQWLDAELSRLLALPFREQQRSPLELFQEAMRFPTASLERAGLAPVSREPTATEALPGDLFGLAPASTQDLGDDVWRVHLEWGAAKARAMTRPKVGLFSSDLMDRSRIEAPIATAGFDLVVSHRASQLREITRLPAVTFVDLAHPEADEVVRFLAESGVTVYGYGPHVDDLAMERARALGAAGALPRSRFFSRVTDYLPTLA